VQFETFLMERNQTLFENGVEINLTESGVHPFSLREFLEPDELQALLDLPLESMTDAERQRALRALATA